MSPRVLWSSTWIPSSSSVVFDTCPLLFMHAQQRALHILLLAYKNTTSLSDNAIRWFFGIIVPRSMARFTPLTFKNPVLSLPSLSLFLSSFLLKTTFYIYQNGQICCLGFPPNR